MNGEDTWGRDMKYDEEDDEEEIRSTIVKRAIIRKGK